MNAKENYLKQELYELIQTDRSVFEFLQEGALDGIWYWDLESAENEWMSPRFWGVLGYDYRKKKHLASEWQDLINPEDLKVAIENFQKHCENPDHPYDQVVRYRHKDGHTVWVRCRGVAIRDESGKPVRMLGAHTDLTPQKKAEEDLQNKMLELEETNKNLQEALDEIKILQGYLPICMYCKKIRDDKGYWQQVERYIEKRSDVSFSHVICPECHAKVEKELENLK